MIDALEQLCTQFGAAAVAAAFAVMFLGGFTKGAVGFALPMIAISGVGSALSAQLAIAAVIAPSVAANLWQTFRQGLRPALSSMRRFWVLNATMFATIAASAQLVTMLSDRALYMILGCGVTAFGAVQLAGWRPPRPRGRSAALEAAVGLVAGFFGGLSGVWGPPILMYLVALELPKAEMVRAQGVAFLLGSLILAAAHLRSGLLAGTGGALSLWMVLPAAAGMAAGLAAHDRLDQRRFRQATLAVLTLAGLNLLRRALF
ncbi:sulfite exporter TauE/SafE family protein [Oceanicella actignis]|uniref:sulfite exporter TauE/SafE family protein n=1 Tax=Oceanicella actignis TaxID=1189325 RepID=UPI0011E7DDBA|nr:sulfite exporter TauE/SafE family protein [Oceanicella actignis]TYO88594.1 hypothetical protein LY05_02256 [Oceanicella actignis]